MAAKRPQRCSTASKIVPEKSSTANGITYREFDRDALIARKPQVALIDELAHTNAPGSVAPKRFHDVLAVLRAGIDVITTLNVQHLEGLSDSIVRLTGTVVRETLPDGILSLADEVTLIDVTPETLRQRMREGKIYPAERTEAALANFFRTENLFALRELALREACAPGTARRITSPFERILLAIGSRAADLPMIARAGRIAARLEIEFAIAHVVSPNEKVDPAVFAAYAPKRAKPTSNGSKRRPPIRRNDSSKSPAAPRNHHCSRRNPPLTALAFGSDVCAANARRRRARTDYPRAPRSREPRTPRN